jgi:hypothetical protein
MAEETIGNNDENIGNDDENELENSEFNRTKKI